MLLDGVRVVSLCHYLQGPAAAQYLADMGADVIKVEPIGGAYERRWSGARVFIGEVSGFYLCANRNKRSISLDLKSEDGRSAFLRLVASADVVMENFRPGTLERLGLGPDVLRGVKEDLIVASASGYRRRPVPIATCRGRICSIQARTGLVAATAGQREDVLPAAAGCAAVDQHGAALFALGIAGALYPPPQHRPGHTRRGQPLQCRNRPAAGIDHQLRQRAQDPGRDAPRPTSCNLVPRGALRHLRTA